MTQSFFEVARNVALFAAYVAASSVGLHYMKAAPSMLSPVFAGGFGLYVGGFLLWLLILRSFPLSVAFPVAAGALMIGTALCAVFLLGEHVSRAHVAGMALILSGIVVIGLEQR
jgi:multidrug transporter EmrE-like cation transporter